MMTRHQRALGEPLGPPAGDTHRTAGTTAVSKVGTEPSRFLSWQDVTDALGDQFSLSDVEMCSGTGGFVLLKVYLPFFDTFFFPSPPSKTIGIFTSSTLPAGTC